jgi:hypothetical protein
MRSRTGGSALGSGVGDGEAVAGEADALGVAVALVVADGLGSESLPPQAAPNKKRRATIAVPVVALPFTTLYLRWRYARG